jgi:GNAT superfamily N-acetyltransferase
VEEKTITTKDGREVRLVNDGGDIVVRDGQGTEIGRLGYTHQEGDYRRGMPDVLSLRDVEIDEAYQRQGIATECVLFAQEITGAEAVIAPHFIDSAKINGNFLTDDGSAFIASLRAGGIVAPHPNDSPD